jgi:hypothetical protein
MMMKKISVLLICIFILAACAPAAEGTAEPTLLPTPQPTATSTPMPAALWVSLAVPDDLHELAASWNIPIVDEIDSATQTMDVSDSGTTWIYTLVAPFPTIVDDVTSANLLSAWKGASTAPLAGRDLLMAESTLRALTALWGEPASGRGAKRSVG